MTEWRGIEKDTYRQYRPGDINVISLDYRPRDIKVISLEYRPGDIKVIALGYRPGPEITTPP